jgi:hypothetical protein
MSERDVNTISPITASYGDFVGIGTSDRQNSGTAWFDLAKIYTYHALREDLTIGGELLPLAYLERPYDVSSEARSKSLLTKEGRKFSSALDGLVVDGLKRMLTLMDERLEEVKDIQDTIQSKSGLTAVLRPKAIRVKFWRKFVDRTIGPVEYTMLDKL